MFSIDLWVDQLGNKVDNDEFFGSMYYFSFLVCLTVRWSSGFKAPGN